MPIRFTCPDCGKPYRVRTHNAGTQIDCTKCSAVMYVPAVSGVGLTEAPDDDLPMPEFKSSQPTEELDLSPKTKASVPYKAPIQPESRLSAQAKKTSAAPWIALGTSLVLFIGLMVFFTSKKGKSKEPIELPPEILIDSQIPIIKSEKTKNIPEIKKLAPGIEASQETKTKVKAVIKTPVVKTNPGSKTKKSLNSAGVYALVVQSVVVVKRLDSRGNVSGFGSGFILEKEQVIVTNSHVIRHAASLIVKNKKGQVAHLSSVAGLDIGRDIALLPIPKAFQKMPGLKKGEKIPAVGEEVFALGAPKGLEFSFTRGIVSAFRKKAFKHNDLIQTDVAISPGSSGGPLVNIYGEIVGINTLASKASENANNLNFAIAYTEINIVFKNKKAQKLKDISFDKKSWDIEK